MVITCESCAMRFRLSDDRVPEGGIRVRCSRCEHAFFVKPARSAGDPVENAVNRALNADETSGEHLHSDAGPIADENDWQFNREPEKRTRAAETRAAPQRPDEVSGATVLSSVPVLESNSEGFLSAGADVDDDIDGLLGDSAGLPGDAFQADETAALEIGLPGLDLAASDSQEHPVEAQLDSADALTPEAPTDIEPFASVGAETLLGIDEGVAESAQTEAVAPTAESLPVSATEESIAPSGEEEMEPAESGDGLGSPENWDFFASGETQAVDGSCSQVPLARIALGPPSELLSNPPVAVESDVEPTVVRRWVGLVTHGVGWLATAAMITLLLHLGSPTLPGRGASQMPVAGLEFENFTARSIDNAVVGPIRVIQGTVRATSGRDVSMETGLAVQLLDADGTVVVDRAATLGAAFSEQMLREWSPTELRERQDRAGGWSLAPGAARSAVALIEATPDSAERFRIVAVPVPEKSSGP